MLQKRVEHIFFCICISLFLPLSESIVSNLEDDPKLQVNPKTLTLDHSANSSTTIRPDSTTTGSNSPSTNNPSLFETMKISTSTESLSSFTMTSEDRKCHDLDKIEMYSNPENCVEYFISCIRPVPQAESESHSLVSGTSAVLMERYAIRKSSCTEGFLFDGIEKLCMVAEQANCNVTYATICQNEATFHSDPLQPSVFIECLNGTAKRQNCQPRGTIFDETTQTCVKKLIQAHNDPPTNFHNSNESKSESFSLSLLRAFVWIVSSTQDKLSPWMESVKLYTNNSTRKYLSENFSLVTTEDDDDEDDDDDILPTDLNNSMSSNSSLNNYSDSEIEFDEQDREILVLTHDTSYLALYYGVMAAIAIIIVLAWVTIAFICSKICSCCDTDIYDDDDEEFFKYDPNDKYVMSRL